MPVEVVKEVVREVEVIREVVVTETVEVIREVQVPVERIVEVEKIVTQIQEVQVSSHTGAHVGLGSRV